MLVKQTKKMCHLCWMQGNDYYRYEFMNEKEKMHFKLTHQSIGTENYDIMYDCYNCLKSFPYKKTKICCGGCKHIYCKKCYYNKGGTTQIFSKDSYNLCWSCHCEEKCKCIYNEEKKISRMEKTLHIFKLAGEKINAHKFLLRLPHGKDICTVAYYIDHFTCFKMGSEVVHIIIDIAYPEVGSYTIKKII